MGKLEEHTAMFKEAPVKSKIVGALDELLCQIEFPKKETVLRLAPSLYDEVERYLDELKEFRTSIGLKDPFLGVPHLPKQVAFYNAYGQKIVLLRWEKKI